MQSIKTVIGNVRFSVNTALKSAKCMRRIGQIHEGSRDFVRVDIRQVTKDCLNLSRQRSLFYFLFKFWLAAEFWIKILGSK